MGPCCLSLLLSRPPCSQWRAQRFIPENPSSSSPAQQPALPKPAEPQPRPFPKDPLISQPHTHNEPPPPHRISRRNPNARSTHRRRSGSDGWPCAFVVRISDPSGSHRACRAAAWQRTGSALTSRLRRDPLPSGVNQPPKRRRQIGPLLGGIEATALCYRLIQPKLSCLSLSRASGIIYCATWRATFTLGSRSASPRR